VCFLIQTIIDKFKKYIADNSLTQGAAAELVNISRTHLNKVLNGKETPSMALLMRIEKAMEGKDG
jgi:DNA-binding XRE family transcriptional regulator